MTGRRPKAGDGGQATVELALTLPFVAVLMLAIVQVALFAHQQVLVIHATREAARAASVEDSEMTARLAASAGFARGADLDPSRVDVRTEVLDTVVVVDVAYRAPTVVPLVGGLFGDVVLEASARIGREVHLTGYPSSGTVAD